MITETVYLSRDNTIDLLLTSDGSAVDLSSVTRMVLNFDGTLIDSDDYPDAFDWDLETTGKVTFALADALAAESVAAGVYRVRLIVYDATNDDGIVWDEFYCIVKSG